MEQGSCLATAVLMLADQCDLGVDWNFRSVDTEDNGEVCFMMMINNVYSCSSSSSITQKKVNTR